MADDGTTSKDGNVFDDVIVFILPWYDFPAMSTFSPVGSPSSDGLRMRVLAYSTGTVRNELICGYASVVHTSSLFRPHTHTHTHTHAI